jgi:superfamily I DNA/RNA helicase
MALVARARGLRERHPDWRMLVLCFNPSLAAFLRRAIPSGPSLEVHTFHTWALAQLVAGGVAVSKPPGRGQQWDEYWTREMAQRLLRAFDERGIAAGAYQAVLVDEGPDFADDWYRALLRALDPATNRLFVALDPSQNIFMRRVRWPEVGVQVAGRTRVLRVNHRNTGPILSAAYRMIRDVDAAEQASSDGRDEPAVPDPALATGPPPELCRCASFDASRRHARQWIRDRLARGMPAEQMLVLGLDRLDMTTVNAWLNSESIAAWLPAEAEGGEGVRVSTIHSAKGLDAGSVLLMDAHLLQAREDADARRLLYIAMTRARRELCVSWFRDSALLAELERACAIA